MPSQPGAALKPGFPRLWLGQSVSVVGSQVTTVALPLTAIMTLHAGPADMGLLRVFQVAPFLLLGLVAGAWVDRRSRLSVLMLTNLGQAVLLACVPVLALTHHLALALLYGIAFLVGTCGVAFEAAQAAIVPSLVSRGDLGRANGRLETSRSVAQVVGPGLGGLLVQLVSAPLALLADCASFLFAAGMLRTIDDPEPERRPPGETSFLRDIWDGLVAVLGHPMLRALATSTTLANVSIALVNPVILLFMVQTLRLSPTLVGLAIAAGGLGGVIGALASARAGGMLPVGTLMCLAIGLAAVATALMAAASGPAWLAVAMLFAGEALFGFVLPLYNVNQLTMLQSAMPSRLQARVHATWRTLTWAAIPIGAYAGGVLGAHAGLRQTLLVSAAGTLVAAGAGLAWTTAVSRRSGPEAESRT